MNPKTTALLLIEYQNDFVKDGGAQHAAVQAVRKSTEMLANSLRLVEGARAHGYGEGLCDVFPADDAPGIFRRAGGRFSTRWRLPDTRPPPTRMVQRRRISEPGALTGPAPHCQAGD